MLSNEIMQTWGKANLMYALLLRRGEAIMILLRAGGKSKVRCPPAACTSASSGRIKDKGREGKIWRIRLQSCAIRYVI